MFDVICTNDSAGSGRRAYTRCLISHRMLLFDSQTFLILGKEHLVGRLCLEARRH